MSLKVPHTNLWELKLAGISRVDPIRVLFSFAPVLPAVIANFCPQLNWLVTLEAPAAALVLETSLTTSRIIRVPRRGACWASAEHRRHCGGREDGDQRCRAVGAAKLPHRGGES